MRLLILALKDLKLISRDKLGMFFMLVFPICMALFFGSMMGGGGDSGTRALKVAVADMDQSPISKSFVESLQDSESVDVTELERDAALDAVRRGKYVGVVIIPPEFGETAGIVWKESPPIELGLDPSRQAEAGMLQGMVMKAMGTITMERFQDPVAMKPAIEDIRQQLASASDVSPAIRVAMSTMLDSVINTLDSVENVRQVETAEADEADGSGVDVGGFSLGNVQQVDVSRQVEPGSRAATMQKVRSGWDISFPQAMVWAILACVAGFATLIVREQTLGTQTRLLVAPLSRAQLLAGKGLACFICLVLVLLTLTLIAVGLGMRPLHWDLLVFAILSIGVCFVGMMLPLSLLGRTEQAVSGAVWGVCTVMAMFGGGMIPVVFMPDFVQTLSDYDPVKWAVYSMEGAIWRDFSFTEMLKPCGILIAVGAVSATLGSWMISRRQFQ